MNKDKIKKVNEKLSKYGEYVPEDELCFKAMLAGILDRMLYDEKRITLEEVQEIEKVLD